MVDQVAVDRVAVGVERHNEVSTMSFKLLLFRHDRLLVLWRMIPGPKKN